MRLIQISAFVAVATGVLVVGFLTLAPETRVEAVKASWRRMTGDVGQLCLDANRKWIDDPGSLIYDKEESLKTHERIWAKYRVKNNYGSYVQDVVGCPLNSKGGLDKAKMLGEELDKLKDAWRSTQ